MTIINAQSILDKPNHHRVIILGSGPAGLTAAIYTARASLSPLLIHGPLQGGQLTTTTEVENWPGYENGIMGPELMATMEKQAARFGTTYVTSYVESVDLSKRPFALQAGAKTYTCDALIIATGATPKLLGLPAEKELMGFGVSTCATCDGAFYKNKPIAVVGGGDSACEEANFLTRFGSIVYLIHRRSELRASKIMQDRVFKNPKIKMLWNKDVKEIAGTKQGGITHMQLVDTQTKAEEKIDVEGVFIAIGHTPNSKLFDGKLGVDDNGYLLTEAHTSLTNVAGVFACGDVTDHRYRQAITASGTGCMAALDAERYLEGLGH